MTSENVLLTFIDLFINDATNDHPSLIIGGRLLIIGGRLWLYYVCFMIFDTLCVPYHSFCVCDYPSHVQLLFEIYHRTKLAQWQRGFFFGG